MPRVGVVLGAETYVLVLGERRRTTILGFMFIEIRRNLSKRAFASSSYHASHRSLTSGTSSSIRYQAQEHV